MSPIRIIYLILGTITLILGIIGIVVPLLPTTPFLLLTAFFYFRGSPKAYSWLLSQPVLGKYILDFRERKIIPLRAKICSLALLWLTISYCIFFVVDHMIGKIVLGMVVVAVTAHILSFKSE